MIRRILAATLSGLPGLLWSGLAVLYREEYYYTTYLAGGVALLLGGAAAAALLAGLPWFHAQRWRLGLAVLAGVAAGWAVGLALMGLLNLTPLCVGQNNGDGVNDLTLCIGYTILWALVYTPLMITGGILLCAAGWAAGNAGRRFTS